MIVALAAAGPAAVSAARTDPDAEGEEQDGGDAQQEERTSCQNEPGVQEDIGERGMQLGSVGLELSGDDGDGLCCGTDLVGFVIDQAEPGIGQKEKNGQAEERKMGA